MKNYFRIIYAQLSDKLGRVSRNVWRNKYEQSWLKNKDFTILSQNCIGSIMYHDLGQQFRSPTINMLFTPSGFLKFVKNPEHYLNAELTFSDTVSTPPHGKIEDLEINFVHYKTVEDAYAKWEERKQRINWDNLFVICCDEGLSYEEIKDFDNLPYKNKIIFLSKNMPEIKCGIWAKRFKDKTDARLLNFANPLGKRYYQNYIDYVEWLNS